MVIMVGAGCADSAEPIADADGNLGMNTPSCDGASKRDVCGALCERFCQNQILHCLGSECGEDACAANGEIMSACQACDDLECARELCTVQLEATCESFGTEHDGVFESSCLERDPECVQDARLGCSNTCGEDDRVGGQLAANGRCEDGHDEDSVSSACNRGTDCEDCGPHPCAAPFEDCSSHADCCGFYGAGALCVAARAGAQTFCVQVCDADRPCPEGATCVETSEGASVCMASEG